MPDNDNDDPTPDTRPSPRRAEPDAHGQAALILAESILHSLVEAGAVTLEQATAAVETACEVKAEVAGEAGESEGRMRESLGLLARIGMSLAASPEPDTAGERTGISPPS